MANPGVAVGLAPASSSIIQLWLFSKPKPSPSGSESLDEQIANSGVLAGAVAGTAGVCPAGSVGSVPASLSTIQLWLFSKPKPSPSGSESLEEQMANSGVEAAAGAGTAGVCPAGSVGSVPASLSTMQLWLFSKPKPSPSGSEALEAQISKTNTGISESGASTGTGVCSVSGASIDGNSIGGASIGLEVSVGLESARKSWSRFQVAPVSEHLLPVKLPEARGIPGQAVSSAALFTGP